MRKQTVREFMLEPIMAMTAEGGGLPPVQGRRAFGLHMVPGLWADPDLYARRKIIVWGDAQNRTMCAPIEFDENQTAVPTDEARSTRQLPCDKRWTYLWPLRRLDRLPLGPQGMTVEAYIAQVEAGGPA